MTGIPWYAPGQGQPPVPQPRPGEPVWSLQKNGRRVDCELRDHGEPYGFEYQVFDNGELAYGRRCGVRAAALAEADAKRRRLITHGWQPEPHEESPNLPANE